MENTQQSQIEKRKFKALVVLPIFIILVLALCFWTAGGGKGNEEQSAKDDAGSKFNTNLPQPKLKNDNWDKLKFYEQAERDSARLQALMKSDPYYRNKAAFSTNSPDSFLAPTTFTTKPINHLEERKDPYEEKIYQRIAAINEQTHTGKLEQEIQPTPFTVREPSMSTESIDRLERMMTYMQTDGPDSEMQQINEVLDKLGAIQNPELRTWKEESEKSPRIVYAIQLPVKDNISLLVSSKDTFIHRKQGDANAVSKKFFSDEDRQPALARQTTITALVYGNHIIRDKGNIRLKSSQDIMVNGMLIPAGQELQGETSINENRVMIQVRNIVFNNNILPISLSAYTVDGLEGIPVQGGIAADVAKQSTDRAIQGLGISSVNSSLAGQALNSSVEAAKLLLRRKSKVVTIPIPSGYRLLLYDKQNK